MLSVSIVRGSVSRIGDSVNTADTVKTTFYIQADEVYKGQESLRGNEVPFWELGGETDNRIAYPVCKELTQTGQEAFFFIKKDGSRYPDFNITNGKVTVSRERLPSFFTDSDPYYKEISVEQLAKFIEEYLTNE